MEDIYIVGASGFGREVAWLIEENNDFKIAGFIDDNKNNHGKVVNGYPVLGGCDYLLNLNGSINVVIAIGKSSVRKIIVDKLKTKNDIVYPNIISKNSMSSKYVNYGEGNIVCCGNILTTNISIGSFNLINLNCTIGHDVVINDFVTVYPGVNISGNTVLGNCCEIGTGSKCIQGITIADNVIVGAGGVVVKNLEESATYVGVPVRKLGGGNS